MTSTKKRKAQDEIDLTMSDDDSVECVGVVKNAAPPKAAKASPPVEVVEVVASNRQPTSNKNKTKYQSDHDLAQALAAEEKCSQFTPAQNHRNGKKRSFECGICMEDEVPGFQGYSLTCKHRFCKPCLGQLIQSSLSGPASSATTKIACPEPKCSVDLSLADVQYILQDTPSEFQRYAAVADLSRLESEAQDDGSDTRRCPAERCNYIFIFSPGTGAEGRAFHCPDCEASFCLQCGANDRKVGPAHPGISCADRQEQLEQQAEERRKFQDWKIENTQADARFNEMLKEEQKQGKTLPCPKCKTVITKNGGCPHMHCTACKTDFNWGGKK